MGKTGRHTQGPVILQNISLGRPLRHKNLNEIKFKLNFVNHTEIKQKKIHNPGYKYVREHQDIKSNIHFQDNWLC